MPEVPTKIVLIVVGCSGPSKIMLALGMTCPNKKVFADLKSKFGQDNSDAASAEFSVEAEDELESHVRLIDEELASLNMQIRENTDPVPYEASPGREIRRQRHQRQKQQRPPKHNNRTVSHQKHRKCSR